jgi:large subunit ribosomal protein L17
MRHNKSFNHLSRTSAHRKALLSNMASSLIMHKRIETTTAKAKALKRYIEPLITRSKEDSTHSRRIAFSLLHDKEAVAELFREVSVKVGDRPGGYTRIIRLGNRVGDNADMCMMELVDFNENLLSEKDSARKATSRRRRGTRKKGEETVATAAPAVEAEVASEAEVEAEPAAEASGEAPADVTEQPEARAEESTEEDLTQEDEKKES